MNLKGMPYQYWCMSSQNLLVWQWVSLCRLPFPDSKLFPAGKLTGMIGLMSEALTWVSEDWSLLLGSATVCFCNLVLLMWGWIQRPMRLVALLFVLDWVYLNTLLFTLYSIFKSLCELYSFLSPFSFHLSY